MSWQMQGVALLMRATRKRGFSSPAGGRRLLTRPKGSPAPPARLPVEVGTGQVEGFEVHTLLRPGTSSGERPVVVYLHGGAYVNQIVRQHWTFAAALAHELDVEVQVPVYGLAPQHRAAEARSLCAAVLEATAGRPTWLAGDSAGASLALLAAQGASAEVRARLRGLTLMAPWLDLTMTNPDLDVAEGQDPWLARAALHEVAAVWAGGTPLDDPLVSPLFGPMAGLPPVDLRVGTRDMTRPDCRRLVDRLERAGVEVAYEEEPGALHVYPLLPVPEGRRAAREIRTRIGSRLS